MNENVSFNVGFVVSFVGHAVFLFLTAYVFAPATAGVIAPAEIFTVTLEGGEKLGGFSQVPLEDKQDKKALPNQQEATLPEPPEEKAPEKKLEQPSVVDDVEKALKEKLAEEKKLAEKKKEQEKLEQEKKEKEKKEKEAKKKEEEKLKHEQEKKIEERKEKERKEKEKKELDKRFRDAMNRAQNRYKGESYSAGGEGIGAARIGGKGFGGGTPASIEEIAYRNELERVIKSGWYWVPGPNILRAQISFSMLPDGTVQNPSVSVSSGNGAFDRSAISAVFKASPLPKPPEGLYEKFRVCQITFESEH